MHFPARSVRPRITQLDLGHAFRALGSMSGEDAPGTCGAPWDMHFGETRTNLLIRRCRRSTQMMSSGYRLEPLPHLFFIGVHQRHLLIDDSPADRLLSRGEDSHTGASRLGECAEPPRRSICWRNAPDSAQAPTMLAPRRVPPRARSPDRRRAGSGSQACVRPPSVSWPGTPPRFGTRRGPRCSASARSRRRLAA